MEGRMGTKGIRKRVLYKLCSIYLLTRRTNKRGRLWMWGKTEQGWARLKNFSNGSCFKFLSCRRTSRELNGGEGKRCGE